MHPRYEFVPQRKVNVNIPSFSSKEVGLANDVLTRISSGQQLDVMTGAYAQKVWSRLLREQEKLGQRIEYTLAELRIDEKDKERYLPLVAELARLVGVAKTELSEMELTEGRVREIEGYAHTIVGCVNGY